MGSRDYYLIDYFDKRYLVLAESSQEAVNEWIRDMETDREQQGITRKFKPESFSIEKIIGEQFLIKVSK